VCARPKSIAIPRHRCQVTLIPAIENWDACTIPLTVLVVRDCFPDTVVVYQAYVDPRVCSDSVDSYQQ